MFKHDFIVNLPLSHKNFFENQLIFGEVMSHSVRIKMDTNAHTTIYSFLNDNLM